MRVLDIVAEHLSLKPSDVCEMDTFDTLMADDLDILEIVMAIEAQFEINIDDDIERFKTVLDLVEAVKAQE